MVYWYLDSDWTSISYGVILMSNRETKKAFMKLKRLQQQESKLLWKLTKTQNKIILLKDKLLSKEGRHVVQAYEV